MGAKTKSQGWIASVVLVLLFEVPLAILYGFVLKTLWNWFVPLVFPAAPHLGIGVAIGLGLGENHETVGETQSEHALTIRHRSDGPR